jgi:serine-type D-Ala-D-Ala carboxypeptidase
MSNIFKNISVTEIITGMESKFYPIFSRYNTTGNLNITIFNFTESNFFYNKIYGDSEYIVPASILKLFSVNYFLNILESNNLLDKQITIGNEVKFLNPTIHKVDLKKGQSYTTRDLIEMALIPSAGDAVYTLSRVVYNILKNNHWNDYSWLKSKDDWLEMVTFICGKIRNYYKTSFNIDLNLFDPTGIQRDLIQVQDIGTLVTFLINSNSKILNVVAKSQTSKINGRTWNSTNAFVRKDKSYYHPKVKGLKTGSLSGWKNLLLIYNLTPTNNVGILVAGCENHSDTKKISSLIIKELDNKLFNISFEKRF